jgi:hypothetical protein
VVVVGIGRCIDVVQNSEAPAVYVDQLPGRLAHSQGERWLLAWATVSLYFALELLVQQ